MKLKLITVFIFSAIFSTEAVYSQTLTEQEKTLQNILRTIENKDKINTEKVENKNSDIKKEVPLNNENNLQLSRFKEVTTVDTQDNFNYHEVITPSANYDHVYLLNIPIKTKIFVNQDLYIHPFRDGIIFKSGQQVSFSPLQEQPKTTFCYIKVKESGQIRRFRSSPDNSLTIESNNSTKQVFEDNEKNRLELYQTTFTVDNPHFEGIRCITTEKTLPLTIGDLNREMGNLFRFDFPEIVDI